MSAKKEHTRNSGLAPRVLNRGTVLDGVVNITFEIQPRPTLSSTQGGLTAGVHGLEKRKNTPLLFPVFEPRPSNKQPSLYTLRFKISECDEREVFWLTSKDIWIYSHLLVPMFTSIYLSIRFHNSCRRLPETKLYSSLFLHWSGSKFLVAMAVCTPSIHVFLGRPLFLLPVGVHSIINFAILSSNILLTWPYHCNLFFSIMSMMSCFPFTPMISFIRGSFGK